MEKKLTIMLLSFLLCVGNAMAQTKISGTVVTQDEGEPIVGASVVPQKQKAGVVTDVDGKFTINVPAGTKLVISYVGMETQTVAARNGMTVRLQSNTTLNEVVVTGMVKVDKRLFTGASTKLNASDTKLDGLADISRSLEGRAAGVSVQNVTGTFGTAPKIRVPYQRYLLHSARSHRQHGPRANG